MKGFIPQVLLLCVILTAPAQAANEDLLGEIKADIAAKRLSSPAGNNALEKIDRFRAEDPFDYRIVPLTYQWGEAYVALAESAIAAKNYTKAQGYLDKVWLVAALTPGLDFGQHRADQHLRLAYTTSLERLEQAVERLQRALGSWSPAC